MGSQKMDMFQKKIIFLFLFSVLNYASSQNISYFNSSGVYFSHMGEVLVENDAFTTSAVIDLEPYHKTIELIKNASLTYITNCNQLNINCQKEYNDLTSSNNDLIRRLNNIYLLLLERPEQKRRKRFIGFAPGFISLFSSRKNKRKIRQLERNVDELREYMVNNFNDIRKVLQNHNTAQIILKDQQVQMKGVLQIHETKIADISKKVNELEWRENQLRGLINELGLRVHFQGIKLDILDILGKLRELEQSILDLTKNILHPQIMSPEEITDAMYNHKINSGKFVATPNIKNYPYITETIAGYAFIVKDLRKIFVNLEIPIYQEQKLNLYEVIEVPVMNNSKTIRIANNHAKYCVVSEDVKYYDCADTNKFTKGRDLGLSNEISSKRDSFYFSSDIRDVSLLPTASSRVCVIDIFTQRSLENCRYKKVTQNLEIMKQIDTNKFLFAVRDKTGYTYGCHNTLEDGTEVITDNVGKDDYLQNTGILCLEPNCQFDTDFYETSFKSSSKRVNVWSQKDVFNFEGLHEEVETKFKKFRFPERLDEEKMKINFEDIFQL